MKATLIALGVLVVLVAAFFGFNSYIYHEEQGDGGLVTDYKTATYYISGKQVYLNEDGVTYLGNEVRGDLDNDGDEDIAFIMSDKSETGATRFFLAGAINTGGKYKGTNAMLIGDTVAPGGAEYKNGQIIITLSDATSLYAKYSTTTNDFGEVVQNFEGESASGQ